MHLLMISIALVLAFIVRLVPVRSNLNLSQKWQRIIFLFIFPPSIIISTCLAIILMGADGKMLGLQASFWGYELALLFCLIAIVMFFRLTYEAKRSLNKISSLTKINILQQNISLVKIDFPYIAQVGFWNPQLVVSQGLLNILEEEHLESVLAHEQAHLSYRDTFWFFWLGWLRSFTKWLPNTELLWQELLLLREMRADLKASESVDSLLLAESLLTVARSSLNSSPCFWATFSLAVTSDRLETRINNLLTNNRYDDDRSIDWSWTILLLLPLMAIPFHN